MNYLLGLLGHPVSHSLSPPMHQAALHYKGLSGDFNLLPVPPAELEDQLHSLIKKGYIGFNVTIPHKESILALCPTHTVTAKKARAANTVRVLPEGGLVAHNTDIEGFSKALSSLRDISRRGRKACVIGYGGAARAAVIALAADGYESVCVVGRHLLKARELSEEMNKLLRDVQVTSQSAADSETGGEFDLIVNSTPLGQASPFLPEWVEPLLNRTTPSGLFFDMVYSRDSEPTPMVKLAEELNIESVDGTEMLIQQAAASFEFWTDETVPVDIFRQALKKAVNSG